MKQIFILLIGSVLVFASCKDRMVCAAFQSSYILDDQKQVEKFSFFQNDSLVLEASNNNYKKDIYGMSERKYGYWQEQRLLLVDQKDVFSEEIDSLLDKRDKKPEEMAEFDMDSAALQNNDTLQFAEGEDAWDNTKRFHYNVDFVNYMVLVGNEVLLAQAVARDSAEARKSREAPAVNDSTQKEGGFLKGLFGGKKNREEKGKGKRRSDNDAAGEVNEAVAVPKENPADSEEGEG
ncbi:hypothetical protein JKA74_07700 [Marivirga sp. S37H4]|uniref:Uncharacterized protein n=1 Tax=Marivirga aurantiaca TaxID=2802615 RepID=A0A934WXV7_9BACT|nr:hypothetical protein [Marivirga aurantiaca]MBK6264917.1 hypothetical protein [Marivirga aurantiaca]